MVLDDVIDPCSVPKFAAADTPINIGDAGRIPFPRILTADLPVFDMEYWINNRLCVCSFAANFGFEVHRVDCRSGQSFSDLIDNGPVSAGLGQRDIYLVIA